MRVTVRNPKYAKRHLWGFYQPEFFFYEGEQVPKYKWSEDGTICLTTGDARWPVREIHPSVIVSIDDVAPPAPVVETTTRTVEVAGSKGSVYHVTISPQGRSCTCSGFQFRKSCKHTKEVA
jgi:hypothetical protein